MHIKYLYGIIKNSSCKINKRFLLAYKINIFFLSVSRNNYNFLYKIYVTVITIYSSDITLMLELVLRTFVTTLTKALKQR